MDCNRNRAMYLFYYVLHWMLIIDLELVSAQNTIRDILSARTDLSTTLSLMEGTDSFNALGLKNAKYTFFAPHNSAYSNVTQEVRNRLKGLPASDRNNLFLYHSATGERRTTLLSNSTRIISISTRQAGSPKLFMILEDQVYINGARFIERDMDSTNGAVSNGVLHIIDRVFVDMAVPSANAYTYIYDVLSKNTAPETRTSEFSKLLDAYTTYASQGQISPGQLKDDVLNSADTFSTSFIPSDQAIASLKTGNLEMYQSLTTGSPQFLQTVMESHVISGRVYHSAVLEAMTIANRTIDAMQGTMRGYWFNGDFYISNNCVSAKVVSSNRTVTNGVVYIVDNLLGFVYNDIVTQTLRTGDLSDFNGNIRAATSAFQDMLTVQPGVSKVPDSQKYTVFAPSNAAFASGEIDFSQNQDAKVTELNMHLISGEMELRLVTNGTRRPTLRPNYDMKFYEIGYERFVEVDYVRAKILKGNLCTKNGIIHIVDKILGVPARTVYSEVEQNPQLVSLLEVVRNTGVTQTLTSTLNAVTLFAPVQGAFVKMRESALGNSLLTRQNYEKLTNVMYRMMGRGYIFLDEIPVNGRKTYNTFFDPITVANENGEYYILLGDQKIRVLQANMRMKNGVVHLIERVLFEPNNPSAGEWTSISAASFIPSISLLNVLIPTMYSFF